MWHVLFQDKCCVNHKGAKMSPSVTMFDIAMPRIPGSRVPTVFWEYWGMVEYIVHMSMVLLNYYSNETMLSVSVAVWQHRTLNM